MATFDELKDEYSDLWASMVVRHDKSEAVTAIARELIAHKSRYQAVEAKTGVPWFVIAALHNRESDADFDTYLGNGEPLDRVTRLVPVGRGPFSSWEAGAIDALRYDGLDEVKEWTPARACYEIETFNGFGYRNHHPQVKSPYLWSFSNHYAKGKYVADGRFSADAVDAQCGAIPVLKRIMELDSSARFKTSDFGKTAAGGAVVVGGGAVIAHQAGVDPLLIALIVILIAAAAITGVAWWRIHKSPKA